MPGYGLTSKGINYDIMRNKGRKGINYTKM